ncbi:MAG: hypothetical protein JWL99_4832 [Streptomyces oryziradicis]|nr:hypothetical protein [Actinacidiphila oryziradicis]
MNGSLIVGNARLMSCDVTLARVISSGERRTLR